MVVKILKSCSGLGFSFREGARVDIPEPLAKDLIRAGHAADTQPAVVEAPEPVPEPEPEEKPKPKRTRIKAVSVDDNAE